MICKTLFNKIHYIFSSKFIYKRCIFKKKNLKKNENNHAHCIHNIINSPQKINLFLSEKNLPKNKQINKQTKMNHKSTLLSPMIFLLWLENWIRKIKNMHFFLFILTKEKYHIREFVSISYKTKFHNTNNCKKSNIQGVYNKPIFIFCINWSTMFLWSNFFWRRDK